MSSPAIEIPGLVPSPSPVARRAVVVSCAFGALAVVGAAVVGWRQAAVLGAFGLAVVVAGLVSAHRTCWTIGDGWVAHRGLFGSTRLEAAAMRAVMVPSDEVRQGDLLFLGAGMRAVALPSDRLRCDPRLAEAVAAVLDLALAGGAQITDDAWRLVGRRGASAAGEPVPGAVVPVPRRERRRSLSAA